MDDSEVVVMVVSKVETKAVSMAEMMASLLVDEKVGEMAAC